MDDSRRAFFGLGWANVRTNHTAETRGGCTRASVARYDEHQIVATWLKRGARSQIVGHERSDAWLHVLSGAIVEERYVRPPAGSVGEWSYEVRHLRSGQSSHLPKGGFHRIAASADASVLTTYSPGPLGEVVEAGPSMTRELVRARERVLGTEVFKNTSVELFAPSGEDDC
jgi:hypothetical protein